MSKQLILSALAFMDQYLDGRRNTIFAQVHTLIYIFDVQKTTASDLVYFGNILDALQAGSGIGVASRSKQRQRDDEDSSEENSDGEHSISGESGPRVHILLHKMDLVESGERQHVYEQRAVEARAKCKAAGFERVQIFATSIYNETLYTVGMEPISSHDVRKLLTLRIRHGPKLYLRSIRTSRNFPST